MSGYDQKLLGSAPATTKEDRQQGYDAALLEKGPTPPPVTSPLSHSPHGRRAPAVPQFGAGSAQGHTPRDPPPDPVYSKQQPFWRTRKGKITIAVVALLIIAIIAGVVGGVVGSRKGGGSSSPQQVGGADSAGPTPNGFSSTVANATASLSSSTHLGANSESARPTKSSLTTPTEGQGQGSTPTPRPVVTTIFPPPASTPVVITVPVFDTDTPEFTSREGN